MSIELEIRFGGPGGHTIDKFIGVPESPRVGEMVLCKGNGRYRVLDVIRHYYGVGLLSVTATVEQEIP
jgi:hypothetical protein